MSGFGEHYLPKNENQKTAEEIAAESANNNSPANTTTDTKSAEEIAAAQNNPNPEPTKTAEEIAAAEALAKVAEENKPQITFDAVKAFLAENGFTRDVSSVEDLLKPIEVEKIVEKEVNPWENLLDEEDKKFFDYKKETGRGRKEFEFLKKDLNSLDLIDLSIQQIKKDTGLDLSKDKAIEYLENKFNIDLTSNDELDTNATIELTKFSKSIKEELIALQEKYAKPSENKTTQTQNNNNGIPEDIVVLDNGTMMKKDAYQTLIDNHSKHVEAVKNSVNGVTESQVKVVFDDNGSKSELSYAYEYSNEDKQSMVSAISDLDSYITKEYASEQGLDVKRLTEDAFWLNRKNREKAISSMIHKAIAENTENLLKNENNISFEQRSLHNARNQEGIKIVPLGGPQEEVGYLKHFIKPNS